MTCCKVNQPENTWDEDYSYNEVVDQASAETFAHNMIESFNKEEIRRYGDTLTIRKVVSVKFLGDGSIRHEWSKKSIVTQTNARTRTLYDIYECKLCKCQGKRLGLDYTIIPDKRNVDFTYCKKKA